MINKLLRCPIAQICRRSAASLQHGDTTIKLSSCVRSGRDDGHRVRSIL